MIFEFVIVYQREKGVSIRDILVERIGHALEDNFSECDSDQVNRMICVNCERNSFTLEDEGTSIAQRAVLTFTLDLPDETPGARTVVDEFVDALLDTPIEHVLKFEDPLLREELAQRAKEIFSLEMKLRRVLSVIYLHAYKNGDPYDLLCDEAVQPIAKEPPKPELMQSAAENQFFHLTFSQYVGLNHRPDLTKMPLLVDLIRAKETYEALQTELERVPVADEDDAVFLAGLKQRMNVIENMRNCVMHNRRPSERATDDYLNVLPEMDQALDDMLTRWSIAWQSEMEEMPWETEARAAVEHAIQSADWDVEAKTITLHDPDEDRRAITVKTRAELEQCLRETASTAFYANVPHEGGEAVFTCDEDGIVQSVLSDYEDPLASIFGDGE